MPYTVVTDGDKAMATAMKQVFPMARHRLCLWHLMRNNIGNSSKKFLSGFMKCVDGCRTLNEFEKAWDELITHHKVKDKVWEQNLYKDKEKWAEALMRGQFCAGMGSTQRCESMNSTLKTRLGSKIMLYKFVELYDQVFHKFFFEEDRDDCITKHTFSVIQGLLTAVKTHAVTIYTRNSYERLIKELNYESRYVVVKILEEEGHPDCPMKYLLEDCERQNSKYVVVYSKTIEKMWCCCYKMESIGLPCRQMFAVMKVGGFKKILDVDIYRRWTIQAKEHCSNYSRVLENLDDDDDEKGSVARFSFLSGLSNQLCRIASSSYDRSLWLKDKLAKFILETKKDKGKNKRILTGIKDPQVVKERGKPKKRKANVAVVKDSLENNQIQHENATQTYAIGPDNDIIKILKSLTPETYTSGVAPNATDCY